MMRRFMAVLCLAVPWGWVAATQSIVVKKEVVSVSYHDLEQFATTDKEASKELVEKIGQAFGPDGLGLLEVTDIPPRVVALRLAVLPMARDLANLSADELEGITRPETFYAIGWSHGREQFKGQYDVAKGSFYMDPFRSEQNVYPPSLQPYLEESLMEMTRFMAQVGQWITKVCDVYLEQQGVKMQRSLFDTLESCVEAKARLLHYFPTASKEEHDGGDSFSDWCGWHLDHGSITALLPGICLEDDNNAQTTTAPDSSAGLYIRTRAQELVHVRLPPTSLGFQIGETMSIQSRGRLQATAHAVKAAPGTTRESLAVFLQPESQEALPPLVGHGEDEAKDPMSLAARWRPTFGAFQQATREAYN
jgi:isopenicillin N synthase-like dioxygenase